MARGGSRFGAGRPAWHVKAENCLRLDVRELARRQLLDGASFAWGWSNSVTGEKLGSISIKTRPGWATLSFSSGGVPICQDVQVSRTPCHFGGTRPWFQCPRCGRRVGVLYLRSGRFQCRHCGRVVYASQSEDELGRGWREQRRIEAKLGEHMCRPKYMRHRTHQRLVSRIFELEAWRDEQFAVFFLRSFPEGLHL